MPAAQAAGDADSGRGSREGTYILQVDSPHFLSSLLSLPSPHPSQLTLNMKGITKAFARYVFSVLRNSRFGPIGVYDCCELTLTGMSLQYAAPVHIPDRNGKE